MCTRQVQMNLFGFLTQNVNEESWEPKPEQQLIYCTEFKMKEFHKHIEESLLEGVKAKVESIGENGVNFI
jgi:hypothetical protein